MDIKLANPSKIVTDPSLLLLLKKLDIDKDGV
jgi:hypothetical protein